MSFVQRLIPGQRSRTSEAVDWETVYAENLPRLYNFFRYRLGDDFLAEDLASATFEKAWKHRKRYRKDLAGFETWLFSIARNLAVSHYRKSRPTQPIDTLELPSHNPGLETQVQRSEEFAHLHRLIAELSEREQELVSLKYGAGLTNREIAHLVGLSETNVGTILHRVVNKLRSRWEVNHAG